MNSFHSSTDGTKRRFPVVDVVNEAIRQVALEPGKKDSRRESATRALNSADLKGLIKIEDDHVIPQ